MKKIDGFSGISLIALLLLLFLSGGAGGKEASKKWQKIMEKKEFERRMMAEKYSKLAEQKRDESIQLLKKILRKGEIEGDQKAELLLRLAELYYEKAKFIYFKEMIKFDEDYNAWVNNPQGKPEPKVENYTRESRLWNKKSIALYKQILMHYPKYQRADEALFYLAYNLSDIGEKKDALRYYNQLVRTFPRSPFVPDAYLSIGEYYFEANNAYKALLAYKKAASYRNSKIYGFGLYKLAWCYYNVGEYDKAINTMKEVISFSEKSESAEGQKIILKDEALKDLVTFFAEAGDTEEAYNYFTRHGRRQYYRSMLKKLAGVYFEQGKNELSISTYKKLIAEDPMSPDNPPHQQEIITAFWRSGNKKSTLEETRRMVETYGPGSAWQKANEANRDAIKESLVLIEKNVRKLALDYHKEAKKTHHRQTYLLAEEFYRLYLKFFPDHKNAYEIKFFFAELLYSLKNYEEAADNYLAVIDMNPKGKHLKHSASSAILSIKKILRKYEKTVISAALSARKAKLTREQLAPIPLAEWEKKFVVACDNYAKYLPGDPQIPFVKTDAANLLYEKNHFDESTKRFMDIIDADPKHKNAIIAANLILDTYNLLKDWIKINEYARMFYNRSELGDKKFHSEMRELYEKASFKIIEQIEADKKFKEAAEEYLKYYQEFPKGVVADKALYNSAVYFHKIGEIDKSIELRHQFLSVFPKSDLMAKNLSALGHFYESLADYERSAEFYESLYRADKNFEDTPNAIYNAGLFREALGDYKTAIQNFNYYIKSYPKKEDTHLVALKVGDIYEKMGDYKNMALTFKKYFTKPANRTRDFDNYFKARLKYGLALIKSGEKTRALRHFKESVRIFESAKDKGEAAPLYYSHMRFLLVEPEFEKFRAIELSLPENVLQRKLEEKGKALTEVIDLYTEVLNLKLGEWGIASLCRIGQSYKAFSDSLFNAPIPPKLTESQVQIYKARLMDRAYPVLSKATEAFEKALLKSYELGIYNEFTAIASKELSELNPDAHPPMEEKMFKPNYVSDIFYTTDFLR